MAIETLPFTCRCGAMQFATEAEAEARVVSAFGTSPLKCPTCHTRASDHVGNFVGEPGDERCFECDGRPHSHGGPS